MAAKCFLSVENLHVASKGLRRAQAIESVLRADDDLMAETGTATPATGDRTATMPISESSVGPRVRSSSAAGPGSEPLRPHRSRPGTPADQSAGARRGRSGRRP